MANWIGLILFCYGSWLLYSGHLHRRRIVAGERVAGDGKSKLAILGEVMPSLVILGLGVAALELILAYVIVGPSHFFALFDLLGVLYLLACYGIWINIKARSG